MAYIPHCVGSYRIFLFRLPVKNIIFVVKIIRLWGRGGGGGHCANQYQNELMTVSEKTKMADELRGCYTLHEMFTIVGSRMTQKDINILKYLYNGIMPQRIIGRVKDGVEFLLGLEKMNRVDETNFKYVVDLLRMISRHDLLQYVTLRKRKPGI